MDHSKLCVSGELLLFIFIVIVLSFCFFYICLAYTCDKRLFNVCQAIFSVDDDDIRSLKKPFECYRKNRCSPSSGHFSPNYSIHSYWNHCERNRKVFLECVDYSLFLFFFYPCKAPFLSKSLPFRFDHEKFFIPTNSNQRNTKISVKPNFCNNHHSCLYWKRHFFSYFSVYFISAVEAERHVQSNIHRIEIIVCSELGKNG